MKEAIRQGPFRHITSLDDHTLIRSSPADHNNNFHGARHSAALAASSKESLGHRSLGHTHNARQWRTEGFGDDCLGVEFNSHGYEVD